MIIFGHGKSRRRFRNALSAQFCRGRVLVTADLVANQNYVELERAETGEKTAANVDGRRLRSESRVARTDR